MGTKFNPRITRAVMEQFLFLESSRQVNMLDRNEVFRKASLQGFIDLAGMIQESPSSYIEILSRKKSYKKRFKFK